MKKKKPKCDCANVIGRNQVCDICQGVEESLRHLLQDTSDTDTYIRERVKGILTDFEINGDSYGVPTIDDIVDLLCKKIESKND